MSSVIVPGTSLSAVVLLVIAAASYYYFEKIKDPSYQPKLRDIPAINAIKEGVGKSLEENKPVHYQMGASGGQLYSTLVSMTLVALTFLRYISRLCAEMGAKLIVHMPYQAESIPLIEGTTLEGYKEAGKPEAFQRENLRYYGRGALTWTQGVTASFAQEGVGLNLAIGIFYSDCPISLEMAKYMNGLNVGGTGRWIMVYAFAMMCDYVFLGEEIYAAAAVVSQDKMMLVGMLIEEVGKFFVFLLLGLGLILSLVGMDVVSLLSM